MYRIVSLFTLLFSLAQGIPASLLRPEYVEPHAPFTIAGNLHFVGSRGLGVFLITTSQGHILIDSGTEGTAEIVLANIRTLGYKPEDVKILLDGHTHFDHVAGHAIIVNATHAAVWAMEGDADVLESGGRTDFLFGKAVSFPPVKVARTLHDRDIVSLGDASLTAHKTAGHTRGNTSWTMTVRDGGKSYSVLIAGSMSINPGTRLVNNPSYPGINDDYAKSFAWLKTQKPDIFLGPHTGFFNMDAKFARLATHPPANPFVESASFAAYLKDWEQQYLKQVAEERGKK